MSAALPVFLVDGFFFLLTYIDILLLQLFVGPEQIAIYYAAVKTLALVAFVYFAVSAASAHRFAEYHAAGDSARLAEFVAAATRWTFWPSLVMALFLIVFGKWILMLFGAGFEAGYPLIAVLAFGLLARASVGPAERLLNMLDQQRACALVYATALAVNVTLCLILVPHFGLMGAAIGTASALIAESALLFAVARKRLCLHIFIWR
jgi:O-antigen/teichoic acid export membrane protein